MSARGMAGVAPIASRIVGTAAGPHFATVDARWLMAYAAAAGLHRPACFDTMGGPGPLAHPLFPVCYEWPLLLEMRARAIGDTAAPFGVHASHHLAIHRLPRAGDELVSTARVVAVAPHRSGTLVIIRLQTTDAGGHPVSETDYGSLYRGVALDGPASGAATAAPGADPNSRGAAPPAPPRWTERVDVPYHLAHIYTECARIWNPIHTDAAAARAAGLAGPILHGTATLALAVSRLVERDLDGDCRAVHGIEARFTGMVPLPSTFTIQAGARDRGAIAFEAIDAAGVPVLRRGVLRL